MSDRAFYLSSQWHHWQTCLGVVQRNQLPWSLEPLLWQLLHWQLQLVWDRWTDCRRFHMTSSAGREPGACHCYVHEVQIDLSGESVQFYVIWEVINKCFVVCLYMSMFSVQRITIIIPITFKETVSGILNMGTGHWDLWIPFHTLFIADHHQTILFHLYWSC